MEKTTLEIAMDMKKAINHAIAAHIENPKSPEDAIRFWDKKTPYVIHPIWCGMTLLTETKLPEDIRLPGYQALIWHDVLEDTNLSLPDGTDAVVARLVGEMTFASFKEEQELIDSKEDLIKLLKLYDKTSILLDATWMKDEKWKNLVDYTLKLRQFVLDTYGDLNIVKIAGAVCIRR
ncbi:MAG: hypothetical protein GYA12_11760 [Chloroflexi bacterium]|nr:hypothetical protein [Chloroflexota bacterium]BCY16298.1 hypothetical protein hrd7_01470 [Leptolinea sp. HRD-7]